MNTQQPSNPAGPPPGDPHQPPPNPTIADLFRKQIDGLKSGEAAQKLKAAALATPSKVKIVPATLNDQVYQQVFMSVLSKLGELLSIDVPKDVVAQAWSKYNELQQYRDLEKFPPDQKYKVVLVLEQTIKSEHKPSVKPVAEIMGKKIELEEIVFPINLELKIKGGEIGIQAGKIITVSIASCEVKGVLGCNYGSSVQMKLAETKEPLKLERVITLDEPVPIKSATEIAKSLAFWKKKDEDAKKEEADRAAAELARASGALDPRLSGASDPRLSEPDPRLSASDPRLSGAPDLGGASSAHVLAAPDASRVSKP